MKNALWKRRYNFQMWYQYDFDTIVTGQRDKRRTQLLLSKKLLVCLVQGLNKLVYLSFQKSNSISKFFWPHCDRAGGQTPHTQLLLSKNLLVRLGARIKWTCLFSIRRNRRWTPHHWVVKIFHILKHRYFFCSDH